MAYNEFTFTVIALVIAWVAVALQDLLVSGLMAIAFGLKFGRTFSWGLLALLIPVILIAYGILIERNCFRTRKLELSFADLPAAFDGYRIVHISDIHSRSFRLRPSALQRAMDKVNSLNPDIVAFTGDLITISPDELDITAPALSRITAPDGVLSILGNHDYCTHLGGTIGKPDAQGLAELISRERALGWNLLLNESTMVTRSGDSIVFVGVENTSPARFFPSTGDLSKASAGTDGTFRILLTHDPQHWDSEVLGRGYPLTLSGHTHSAQISLFGWSPGSLMFRRLRGLYKEGSEFLYVNIGLGETAYPARIGAIPEITLITLRRSP